MPNWEPTKGQTPSPRLVTALEQVLAELPGREAPRLPLPRAVQDALARASGRPAGEDLDRLLAAAGPILAGRNWQARLIEVLLAPGLRYASLQGLAASLLALRPLPHPDRLVARLEAGLAASPPPVGPGASTEEAQSLAWRMLALVSTDDVATLGLWRSYCALAGDQPEPEQADPLLFLCWVKLLQHRLLLYPEFSRAVVFGRVLHPETGCGRQARAPYYHPVLDYLGISDTPYFRLMYQRLVHEATLPEGGFGWEHRCWIRRYSGLNYLLRGMQGLMTEPSLEALHMARWASDFGDPEYLHRFLGEQPLPLVFVLALVRRDLDGEMGAALADPRFALGMRWLRLPGPAAFRRVAKDAHLREWLCARPVLCDAIRALLAFKPPESHRTRLVETFEQEVAARLPGYAQEEQRRRLAACFREHLGTDLPALAANMDLALGVRGKALRAVMRHAREGRPGAIRALGLYGEPLRDRMVPVLMELRAGGSRPVAEAATEALELVAARCGLGGIGELEERVELQLAWEDAGLEGGPSRLWWSVAGYNLKLAVTGGRVTVTAYGRRGPCRTLPAAVRAHPDYQQVKQARRQLGTSYARFRSRLEAAMVAGRDFEWGHFRMLLENAAFRNLVERLVLDDGQRRVLGSELLEAGAEPERVRVVHPVYLLAEESLRPWQDRLAEQSVIQPFKQCFREVYPLEPGEEQAAACRRFAGQPLNARKAFALLRTCGYHPGSGTARRDWPQHGVWAGITWADGARVHRHLFGDQVEEPVYTGAITFHVLGGKGRGPEQPLALSQVDPVVFSETLRDADLLLSHAAAGELGFSSRQTIQIRAAMLRQLARILKLWNIFVSQSGLHALVQGTRATYRVHLGSGTIFLEPEGKSVTLRPGPTPAPLPVEDADSGTARVLTTVLSLAQDAQIADPAFLRQLRPQQPELELGSGAAAGPGEGPREG